MPKIWFLTLKQNVPKAKVHEIDPKDYMDAFLLAMSVGKNSKMIDNAFEEDEDGRLHFHVIIQTDYIKWSKFTDIYKGTIMHINNKELVTAYDFKKVANYVRKCKLQPYIHTTKVVSKFIESHEYPFDIQDE